MNEVNRNANANPESTATLAQKEKQVESKKVISPIVIHRVKPEKIVTMAHKFDHKSTLFSLECQSRQIPRCSKVSAMSFSRFLAR